jgi:hypothetical protein
VFLDKGLVASSALQWFDVVDGILSSKRSPNQSSGNNSLSHVGIGTKDEIGALIGSDANAIAS